jgi:hypothetical protein
VRGIRSVIGATGITRGVIGGDGIVVKIHIDKVIGLAGVLGLDLPVLWSNRIEAAEMRGAIAGIETTIGGIIETGMGERNEIRSIILVAVTATRNTIDQRAGPPPLEPIAVETIEETNETRIIEGTDTTATVMGEITVDQETQTHSGETETEHETPETGQAEMTSRPRT